MRNLLRATVFILALALAPLLLSACDDEEDEGPAPPDEVQLDEGNNGDRVDLAAGGTLIIALPSNPTTGYSWQVIDPSGGLEQQGDPTYVPAGSTEPVVGAGGTEVFTFKAGEAGEYKLGLGYKRPFEPEAEPQDTFRVTVTVH